MSEKYLFSDYHSVDFDACLAIFASNCPAFFHPDEQSEFEAFLLDLPGPYLIMRDNNQRIIGCGGYAYNANSASADLCWGMIHADFQQRGFGKALLQERLQRIQQNPDIKSIHLSTSQKTIAFFGQHAFKNHTSKTDGFAPGLDTITMKLNLVSTKTG